MATLPQPVDPKALANRFEQPAGAFTAKAAMLAKLPLTQDNAEQALTWDTQAKQFLEGVEKEVAPVRKKLFEAHRDFVALIKRQTDPVARFRSLCSTFRANYERERQRKIAEQKRLDEQRQLADQQRQREAERDHLLEVAAATNDESALAAAIEVENAPLAPVVSTVDPDAGKVPGSSVTMRKTGLISDVRPFLRWLAEYASAVDLIEIKVDIAEAGPVLHIKQSALDDKLNRGIEIPGVEVLDRAITRNTSRG